MAQIRGHQTRIALRSMRATVLLASPPRHRYIPAISHADLGLKSRPVASAARLKLTGPRRHKPENVMSLPDYSMRQLLEAGWASGHQAHRWNPKMPKFIFGSRNNLHIIDLAKT